MAVSAAKYIIPGEFSFDATLTVNEFSFDYAGFNERTFLHAFNSSRLAIAGQYSEVIALQGTFRSSDPAQQEQLAKLGADASLTLSLPKPESQLEIKATEGRSFNFQSLTLLPQTQIKSLTYQPLAKPKPASLSFKLRNCQSQANKTCQLRFFPGTKPIQINGTEVAIAELPDLKTPQLIYTPVSNSEIVLELTSEKRSPIGLELDIEKSVSDFFSGNLNVTATNFQRQVKRGRNVADSYRQSTITKGTARLKDKTLTLEASQYLSINPSSPGIQRLERLQISQKPPGLQLFVSGRAEKLSAGLNPKLPTQNIGAKWLDSLPSEVMTGLIGTLAGIWGTLFGRLFEEED
ncbi:MAG: hypothetical protein ACFCA4_13790 [Cyanophyceae cyanobacterium]